MRFKILFSSFCVQILVILGIFGYIESLKGEGQRSTYEKTDFRVNSRQSAENEPGLPSNLPSPPKPPAVAAGSAASASFGRQNGNEGQQNGAGSLFTRLPQLPPPHVGPDGGPIGPGGPGGGFFGGFGFGPAFGLAHTLLILVPQFKVKIQGLPKWLGSNVKYSFPITIFFDKMSFPPPPPNPENPFDYLGLPPPPIHFGEFFKAHKIHKRSTAGFLKNKSPNQIIGGERSIFIPKISSILDSIGIEPNCLLRFICEIHQSPLHTHFGLLGETLTTLFSVSKSSFAVQHMPDYLLAEESGKFVQNCSNYTKICTESLFH